MQKLLVVIVGVVAAVGLPIQAAMQPSAKPAAPAFEADPAWPAVPNNWVLGDVSSIAVDAHDNVWILHRPRNVPADQRSKAAPAVIKFDRTGRFVTAWGGPAAGYDWPEREHGIYVDQDDAVWISGNNGYGTPPPPGNSDDMLLKFTTAGKLLLQIGHSGRSTGNADTGNVRQAADMFLYRPSNELFVADGYGNHRVIVFDAKTGAFKRMWGAFGKTPQTPGPPQRQADPLQAPQFGLVHAIKVSNDGLVYVADRANKRVQVFTVKGEYRQQVPIGADTAAAQTAAGLALSPDPAQRFLYVADLGNSLIEIFDRQAMQPISSFGSSGNAPGQFATLHHIAVDSRGNIYTAEINRNKRAQKFTLKPR